MTTNQQRIELEKKFWDVKKAGERLLWRFQKTNGNYKAFTPNESDEIALKSVLSWINRNATENVNNNKLFAKLYIYFLTQEIRYNSATVFDSQLQKNINAKLAIELPLFYKAFISDLYGSQYARLTKGQTLQESNEVINDILKFKETFNEDYCIGKLNEMISEALNRFS